MNISLLGVRFKVFFKTNQGWCLRMTVRNTLGDLFTRDSNKRSCGIHFFKVLVQIHYSQERFLLSHLLKIKTHNLADLLTWNYSISQPKCSILTLKFLYDLERNSLELIWYLNVTLRHPKGIKVVLLFILLINKSRPNYLILNEKWNVFTKEELLAIFALLI